MSLADLGEFGFIDTIAARVTGHRGVRIGIGDDTAVTDPSPGMVLLTTADLLAEGVHFDRRWSDPRTLGRKSLAVNLSDIAAMGGIPRHALLSLAVPADLPAEFVDEFIAGFLEKAARFDVALIGGDTSASRGGLFINVTLIGEQEPHLVIPRSGARPGDLVCVTGTLGDAALGLELLKNGVVTGGAVHRHLDPEPRVAVGRALAEAGIPSAMIDVSDGLVADLGHILGRSGVGGRLQLSTLPLSGEYRELGCRYGTDFYSLCLGGGEDYELLFTVPPSRLADAVAVGNGAGVPVAAIGEIVAESGVCLLHPDGGEYRAARRGYDHFRASVHR